MEVRRNSNNLFNQGNENVFLLQKNKYKPKFVIDVFSTEIN